MRMYSAIASILICLLCLTPTQEVFAYSSIEEQRMTVAMRMVGHKILNQVGDSTSRVLPIEVEGDQYRIRFESEFSFVGEDIVIAVDEVFEEIGLDYGYLLAVEDCDSSSIVYSFQVGGSNDPDVIPCRSRAQPLGCYEVVITLLNQSELLSMDILVGEEGTSGTLGNRNITFLFVLLGLIALIIVFFVKRRKKPNPSHLIPVGGYQFDKRNTALLYGQNKTDLTHKEAELLLLLLNSINSTVSRDAILQTVWGDEGNYVGRTLDVFISKLRKKLEADADVKIINIRGVGYKLVVNE